MEDEGIQEGAGVVVREKPLGKGAVVGVWLLPRCWVGLSGAVARWVGWGGNGGALGAKIRSGRGRRKVEMRGIEMAAQIRRMGRRQMRGERSTYRSDLAPEVWLLGSHGMVVGGGRWGRPGWWEAGVSRGVRRSEWWKVGLVVAARQRGRRWEGEGVGVRCGVVR